jgi:hypothetical protein
MTGYELKQSLMNKDADSRCFINWWRKENDFADYELIDRFLENLTPEREFEVFELLSMDDMYKELKRHASKGSGQKSTKESRCCIGSISVVMAASEKTLTAIHLRCSWLSLTKRLMATLSVRTHGGALIN